MFSPPSDSRIINARWVDQQFRQGEKAKLSHADIILKALEARYSGGRLAPQEMQILEARYSKTKTIFDLCHLVGELENLSHMSLFDRHTVKVGKFGRTIQEETFAVMDAELISLGYAYHWSGRKPNHAPKIKAGAIGIAFLLLGYVAYLNVFPPQKTVKAAPAFTAAKATPPPTSAKAPPPVDLQSWGLKLNEARKNLDPKNAAAVAAFNKEVALYQAEKAKQAGHF
ncbi:MAG: hypothetical protein JWL59_4319 [Chthoniobacteraceae bacterium]|nr:hypothetical protein [Chthoniobacteraceae bacterium]